jgi:hypothetical protein
VPEYKTIPETCASSYSLKLELADGGSLPPLIHMSLDNGSIRIGTMDPSLVGKYNFRIMATEARDLIVNKEVTFEVNLIKTSLELVFDPLEDEIQYEVVAEQAGDSDSSLTEAPLITLPLPKYESNTGTTQFSYQLVLISFISRGSSSTTSSDSNGNRVLQALPFPSFITEFPKD